MCSPTRSLSDLARAPIWVGCSLQRFILLPLASNIVEGAMNPDEKSRNIGSFIVINENRVCWGVRLTVGVLVSES